MHLKAVPVAIGVALALCQPVSASTLVGTSANTLPEGKFMLDTWFMWQEYTTEYETLFRDGEPVGAGWVALPSDVTRTRGTIAPRLLYGVTDWLTIRMGVPLEDRFVDVPGDFDASGAATGLGDLVIDPKIQVYRAKAGYPRGALLLGVRFPTGDTEGTPAVSDGSTDYVGGAAVTHRVGDVSAHACVVYWLNGEAESGRDVPDLWVGSASVETPIDGDWSLLWEAKAYVGSEDSMYRRGYVCPGIAWTGEHLTLGVSAFIPVYRMGVVNASNRFDYDWAPYVRLYYRFF